MTDYASLKVPDLKKLLTERNLPQTGNKADLVARLQENDKSTAEDVIDWDDDDTKVAPVVTKQDALKPAPAAVAPASPPKETPAPAASVPSPAKAEPVNQAATPAVASPKSDATPAAEPAKNGDAPAEATEPEKPLVSYAAGLSATDLDKEMKKRAERAQRFGIQVDADSDEAKKAERAQRFGIEASAVPKGLDEALPERRPKRGREGDARQGANKRPNTNNRNEARGRNNTSSSSNPRAGRGRNDRDGDRPARSGRNGAASKSVLDDPNEKAKAERRAARFGGDN